MKPDNLRDIRKVPIPAVMCGSFAAR
jgi:hypothetical protein